MFGKSPRIEAEQDNSHDTLENLIEQSHANPERKVPCSTFGPGQCVYVLCFPGYVRACADTQCTKKPFKRVWINAEVQQLQTKNPQINKSQAPNWSPPRIPASREQPTSSWTTYHVGVVESGRV